MKHLLFSTWIFIVTGLYAAPLEGGFALAPGPSASREERAQAYLAARQRVIEAAGRYEGVPYLFGGMTARGLDCSGFIALSFHDALGITPPRSASGLFSWSERIPYERAQPGDFLFFRTGRTRNITHVGIYLGNRSFIHSASAGAKTGVIHSSLDETYWANAFAGAGRVFPEIPSGLSIDTQRPVNDSDSAAGGGSSSGQAADGLAANIGGPAISSGRKGRFLLGAGLAPIWNGFLPGGNLIRGFTSQLLIGADTHSLGMRMVFGFELRPEYDNGLGVFRLPMTFSWGPNERIRIFAGPVLSFGEAAIYIDDEERRYSGGTSWLGTVGVTAAPFAFKAAGSEFAPYIEAAWQSYFSDNSSSNLAADFSAGFRFSTGLRWMIHIR